MKAPPPSRWHLCDLVSQAASDANPEPSLPFALYRTHTDSARYRGRLVWKCHYWEKEVEWDYESESFDVMRTFVLHNRWTPDAVLTPQQPHDLWLLILKAQVLFAELDAYTTEQEYLTAWIRGEDDMQAQFNDIAGDCYVAQCAEIPEDQNPDDWELLPGANRLRWFQQVNWVRFGWHKDDTPIGFGVHMRALRHRLKRAKDALLA